MKKTKNKYILPMEGLWYVEYGGITKKDSHSWNIISQRYAYDFEIRKNNLPYKGDYTNCENYYSYKQNIIAPSDGWVIDIKNEFNDTRILKERPAICDADDPRGNYILLKHSNNEYSLVAHILKNSFKVKVGDLVKEGQIIARVGNSGNTEGPHIHFQVQKGNDFNNSQGLIISFKNILKQSNNKFRNIKFIKKKNYIKNK